MYVLENYPNADLSKKEDREMIADALSGIMCDHHIVSYTNWEEFKKIDYEALKKDLDEQKLYIPTFKTMVKYVLSGLQESNFPIS